MHGVTSVSLTTSELEEYSEDNVAMKHSRFYEALEIQPLNFEKTILRFQQQGLTCSPRSCGNIQKYPEETAPCPFTFLSNSFQMLHRTYVQSSHLKYLDFQLGHIIQFNQIIMNQHTLVLVGCKCSHFSRSLFISGTCHPEGMYLVVVEEPPVSLAVWVVTRWVHASVVWSWKWRYQVSHGSSYATNGGERTPIIVSRVSYFTPVRDL